MNPDKAVVLKSYSLVNSADAAASCLTAHGIECLIRTDDCGGMLSALALQEGVKLVVDADDEEQAREILSVLDTSAPVCPK